MVGRTNGPPPDRATSGHGRVTLRTAARSPVRRLAGHDAADRGVTFRRGAESQKDAAHRGLALELLRLSHQCFENVARSSRIQNAVERFEQLSFVLRIKG